MRSPLVGSALESARPRVPRRCRCGAHGAPVVRNESAGPGPLTGVGCVLLLPPELEGRVDRGRTGHLTALTRRRVCGYPAPRVISATLESSRRAAGSLDECVGLVVGRRPHERFVVLIEAWQPPIRENLQALKLLGQDERGRSLILVLCGRPRGARLADRRPSGRLDREVWADGRGAPGAAARGHLWSSPHD
jgi:hypothetical protein